MTMLFIAVACMAFVAGAVFALLVLFYVIPPPAEYYEDPDKNERRELYRNYYRSPGHD